MHLTYQHLLGFKSQQVATQQLDHISFLATVQNSSKRDLSTHSLTALTQGIFTFDKKTYLSTSIRTPFLTDPSD